METRILEAINAPKELEMLYRENPDEFIKTFPSIFASHSESAVLQVWQERLNYEANFKQRLASSAWSYKNIITLIILALAAGTIFNLPTFFNSIDSEWFFARNLSLVFIVPLIIYFLQRFKATKFSFVIISIALAALLYLNLLPSRGANSYAFSKMYGAFEDALTNAELHIPLFLWLLTGVAFAGKEWRKTSARMDFLRFNGELIIYTTILLLGLGILSAIILILLNFIDGAEEIFGWYNDYGIVYLAISTPIVATFLLDKVVDKRVNIAPTIAKIFTPLFLITTFVYLILMVVYKNNPFDDREYLMALNVLSIVVLGLLIFTIAERNLESPPGANDYLNIGLALTTIIIDAIALTAVLFRSTSDSNGLTPNRLAIIGINILVFGHLTGILIHYSRFVWKNKSFEKLEEWIAGYLPSYAIWAICISVLLPVLFWYK